jgi:hypothetical protein
MLQALDLSVRQARATMMPAGDDFVPHNQHGTHRRIGAGLADRFAGLS